MVLPMHPHEGSIYLPWDLENYNIFPVVIKASFGVSRFQGNLKNFRDVLVLQIPNAILKIVLGFHQPIAILVSQRQRARHIYFSLAFTIGKISCVGHRKWQLKMNAFFSSPSITPCNTTYKFTILIFVFLVD